MIRTVPVVAAAAQGGRNWQLPGGPDEWAPLLGTDQLMVVGVDVTHGLTSSKQTPSVAAVVGSQDPDCTRYAAALLEQTAGHEVVLGMREAMTELLQGYYQARGQVPESILVFRDGVSDSQYAAVLQQEVADIKAACAEVAGTAFNPKVTLNTICRTSTPAVHFSIAWCDGCPPNAGWWSRSAFELLKQYLASMPLVINDSAACYRLECTVQASAVLQPS